MTLLDTNVILELMKAVPSPAVLAWMSLQAPEDLFMSTISMGEILFGIELLPKGKRREALLQESEITFTRDFSGRVLSFDEQAARMFGSEHNDSIADKTGRTITNHAGGVVGGISNGNEVVFRIAIKPTSSTPKEQETFNRETGEIEKFSVKGRHDLCIALRVPVVLEAVSAIVFADLLLLEQKVPRVLEEDE